jgi:phosphoesterase RecJ-like protein
VKEKKMRLAEVALLLSEHDRVIVLGHQFPDGDAIGSVLGLGRMLAASGREVQAGWPEPFDIPAKYSFLPGMDLLTRPAELDFEGRLANASRLEELEQNVMARPVINVDHHPDNTMFGTVNIVDETAAATSQLIFSMAPDVGLVIDREVAICLYTGLVTDTGRFQFSNTTAVTLRMAGDLMSRGVEPHTIFENVYQDDSLEYLRLSGDVLRNAVYEPDLGLIYGFLSQEDLRSFGVRMSETEDLIDYLRALRGHRVVALFKEQADGRIRVSLRSRIDTDIGSIARKLGGGGHRVAAGYTSTRTLFGEALDELKDELIEAGRGPGNR